MMNKETGGPAFPQPLVRQLMQAGEIGGMTLRDYFAAKAMQGIFGFWVAVNAKTRINDPDPKIVAEMSYDYADAMLKARES